MSKKRKELLAALERIGTSLITSPEGGFVAIPKDDARTLFDAAMQHQYALTRAGDPQ